MNSVGDAGSSAPIPVLTPPGRLRSAWRFLLFILLYLLFLFGFGTATAVVLALVWEGTPDQVVMVQLLTLTAGFPAVTMATAVMVGAVDHQPSSSVGLGFQAGWGRETLAGLLLGIGLIVLVVFLEWITGHLEFRSSGVPLTAAATSLVTVFLVFLVVAWHEELLFRGYPFQRLLEVMGAPWTVLLLSVAFGAVHYGNPHVSGAGVANTALVGILFALAYLATRRLWLPIGLHWGWNFCEAAFGLPVSGIRIGQMTLVAEVRGNELFHGGDYGPEASLVASGAIMAGIVALGLRMRSARNEVP